MKNYTATAVFECENIDHWSGSAENKKDVLDTYNVRPRTLPMHTLKPDTLAIVWEGGEMENIQIA